MENLIRPSVAVAIFVIMVTWEYLSPRRIQHIERKQRWLVNLGLALANLALMRLTIGSLAYMSAVWAAENGLGLLNIWALTNAVSIVATLLILDFAIYAQHIMMHKSSLLWRLHKIHHTDMEFDATTAVRFHPLEIVISMLYKTFCIVLIGADPVAVIVFEIILNGAATFNHSNINIPEIINKKLCWLIVTPDMHRIHHSAEPDETDSNYGFSISCWDRLCRTYKAKSRHPQTTLAIGLKAYRRQAELGFMALLRLPFKSQNSRNH
ncbi:MAG: sterol desaturase family protein [Methyloglobulus sp.]|uniref:sterol desaturase family protein n=1 Tax=Methyloglobulus sp. TaxID=2518622 RepID=UPI00184346BB|nr:sterol desaturase family protein [Methyloglobulus sp.]